MSTHDPAAIARGLTDGEKFFLPKMASGRSHRVSTLYPMLQRLRGMGLVEVVSERKGGCDEN